jgi:hypothetical protein
MKSHISRGRWRKSRRTFQTARLPTRRPGASWFDRAGNFHSDALHVVERYTRTGPDLMNYEVTI